MTTSRQMTEAELDQLIADEFGVNADYVSELFSQFERDRSSVDEEWRSVFDELVNNGDYCVADPGHTYAVYLPHGGKVTVQGYQAPLKKSMMVPRLFGL